MFDAKEQRLIDRAIKVMESKMKSWGSEIKFNNPASVKAYLTDYFRLKLNTDHEQFLVIFVNTQHEVIESKVMFRGTIDSASVYPREVAKEALNCGASAVILAHNHPSGSPEPSQADISLTRRIQEAFELLDMRVLDHIIVGRTLTSLAERGLI